MLGNDKEKQKTIFCVALMEDGTTEKKQSDNIQELMPMISKATISWVNCSVKNWEESILIAEKLEFERSLVPTLFQNVYSGYEDLETNLGIMLPAIKVNGLNVDSSPLLILMKKNLILTIHSEKITRLVKFSRYADIFIKKIKKAERTDKLTIILNRIIDENNEKNFDGLRVIQDEADRISSELADVNAPRKKVGKEIYDMKHALITYLNFLWASLDVIQSLRYGDAELISDNNKILEKIGLLAEDIKRQITLSEHMSEVLASGLEVLQGIYNNQLQILNNKMALVVAWLTLLGTAILVPNTIATIVGSGDFGFISDNVYIYSLILIFSTIISTLIAYFWVKSRGLLKKTE